MSKITLLIPFFNEGERVLEVLDQVTKIPELDQIVCVDDGSTDNMFSVILENYDVQLIRTNQNTGKSTAIKLGMLSVETDWVFLSDADLCQINIEEFRTACQLIKYDTLNMIDMLILRRMQAPWFVKVDRGDILFSGERILKSCVLSEILKNKVEHYQLEIAINQWMLEHKKNVYWTPSSVTNTYKFQKLGLIKGLTKEFKMWCNIITYIGPKNYLNQIIKFGRKRIYVSLNRKSTA